MILRFIFSCGDSKLDESISSQAFRSYCAGRGHPAGQRAKHAVIFAEESIECVRARAHKRSAIPSERITFEKARWPLDYFSRAACLLRNRRLTISNCLRSPPQRYSSVSEFSSAANDSGAGASFAAASLPTSSSRAVTSISIPPSPRTLTGKLTVTSRCNRTGTS